MSRYLYFIRPVGMQGPVKIGSSNIPERRLEALMKWSPYVLEIVATAPGSHALEFNVQDCFYDDLLHHEWFHPSARLDKLMADLRAGVPLADALDLNDRRGDVRAAHYALRSANRRANTRRQAA